MIIVDFSQIMIMSIMSLASTIKDEPLNEDMIRHVFLNNILTYKNKYSKEFGDEIVIACDGKGYWRKSVFPYYKYKRAESRADSPLDWEFIFQCIAKLHDEIEEYFPYKVVKIDGCEGDDVISILVHHFSETRFLNQDSTDSGLFEDPEKECEPILIISADKDFLQLQMYSHVKQYSPVKRGLISEDNPKLSRYEKILKGDTGDGIMNVFSDDDTFVVPGKRQTPASAKRLEPLLNHLMNHGSLPDDTDQYIKDNFKRNKMLIDLYEVSLPDNLKQSIIDRYYEASSAPKSKVYQYFVKYQLRNLFSQVNNF